MLTDNNGGSVRSRRVLRRRTDARDAGRIPAAPGCEIRGFERAVNTLWREVALLGSFQLGYMTRWCIYFDLAPEAAG